MKSGCTLFVQRCRSVRSDSSRQIYACFNGRSYASTNHRVSFQRMSSHHSVLRKRTSISKATNCGYKQNTLIKHNYYSTSLNMEAPPPSSSNTELTKDVERMITELTNLSFGNVYKRFDETISKALPESTLSEVWKQQANGFGKFVKVQKVQQTPYGQQYTVCTAHCVFETGTLNVVITFNNSNNLIAGFQLFPVANYTPPKYAKTALFNETDIEIGDEWKLSGKLVVPKSASSSSPVPCVILVHGSGPSDMDECLMSIKVFKDIAWGLGSKGIGVLRYNKRTFQYAAKMQNNDNITIEDEVIDDAVNAFKLARTQPLIDPSRIYICGHSLGGMMLPSIGNLLPDAAGLVMLAGSPRKLEDLMIEQYEYINSITPDNPEVKEQLARAKKDAPLVKQLTQGASQLPHDIRPFNIHPKYWVSINLINPLQEAKKLKQRMYVLQGEKDYQVLYDKDFKMWKEGLKDMQNVSFKSYPSLNHLFIECEKTMSTPEDYFAVGNVSSQLINDISDWILMKSDHSD